MKLHSLSLLAASTLALGTAQASLIPIPNHSFEDPILAPGGIDFTHAGWTRNGAGGVFHPNGSNFLSASPLAAPADGNQLAFFESGTANPGSVTLTSAAPLTTAIAGFTYTLTAALGHRNLDAAGGRRPDDYLIELLLDNTPVASNTLLDAHTNIPSGTWVDLSTAFTPMISGGEFTIRLTHSSDDATFRQGVVDNIRLDAVPEPSTFALTALGWGALLGLRRRRNG